MQFFRVGVVQVWFGIRDVAFVRGSIEHRRRVPDERNCFAAKNEGHFLLEIESAVCAEKKKARTNCSQDSLEGDLWSNEVYGTFHP